MGKTIITTGNVFTDIDGLACIVAYRELLTYEKIDAVALIQGTWNHSIPERVNGLDIPYEKETPTQVDNTYVVMDVSDVLFLQKSLDLYKVTEIYDHHFGSEKYWVDRLGTSAHIERVGSCATLVIEEFWKRAPQHKISTNSANLLAWAIISNTLNFRASVTVDRDIKAFEYIKSFIDLEDDWVGHYFTEHDRLVYSNPVQAMRDDTKIAASPLVSGEIAIAQIELWNGGTFISIHRKEIEQMASNSQAAHWLLTIPSIKDGCNYLFTVSDQIKDVLEARIGATFDGNLGTTRQLYLRKEILREMNI